MKDFWFNLKIKLSSFIAYLLLYFIGMTIKFKSIGEENLKLLIEQGKNLILVTWHGRMFIPIYYLKRRGIHGIVSQSRDGEYFANLFRWFGWKIIKGSSRRKGAPALLSAIKILKNGSILAITPDGPVGPVQKVQPGVIYLASKTGSLIIPVGASCRRKKFLNSWDRALIPLPFCRGIIIFGEPMIVQNKLEKESIPEFSLRLENKLNRLMNLADSLVD